MIKWIVDDISKYSISISNWYRQKRRRESEKCVKRLLKNYHDNYINMTPDFAEELYLWSLRLERDKE